MLSANDFKKKQVIFLMTNIGDKLSFSNDNVVCCWKYIYNEWLDTKK